MSRRFSPIFSNDLGASFVVSLILCCFPFVFFVVRSYLFFCGCFSWGSGSLQRMEPIVIFDSSDKRAASSMGLLYLTLVQGNQPQSMLSLFSTWEAHPIKMKLINRSRRREFQFWPWALRMLQPKNPWKSLTSLTRGAIYLNKYQVITN